MDIGQLAGNERGVLKPADPDRQVISVGDEVDASIFQTEMDLDARVRREERVQRGREMTQAEGERCGQPDPAGQRVALRLDALLDRVDVGDERPGALEEALARIGEAEASGRAAEQSDTEARLCALVARRHASQA